MIEIIIVRGEPKVEERSCADCTYNRAAVSWWCRNPEAVSFRGTAIPGVRDCSFYVPARKESDLSLRERLFGDFLRVDNSTSTATSSPTK